MGVRIIVIDNNEKAKCVPNIMGKSNELAGEHLRMITEKIQSGTTRSQSHTMLTQDSFLGSLLVLPVELWNGIAG